MAVQFKQWFLKNNSWSDLNRIGESFVKPFLALLGPHTTFLETQEMTFCIVQSLSFVKRQLIIPETSVEMCMINNITFCKQQYTHGSCYISLFNFNKFLWRGKQGLWMRRRVAVKGA